MKECTIAVPIEFLREIVRNLQDAEDRLNVNGTGEIRYCWKRLNEIMPEDDGRVTFCTAVVEEGS